MPYPCPQTIWGKHGLDVSAGFTILGYNTWFRIISVITLRVIDIEIGTESVQAWVEPAPDGSSILSISIRYEISHSALPTETPDPQTFTIARFVRNTHLNVCLREILHACMECISHIRYILLDALVRYRSG